MWLLYDLTIFFYGLAIRIAALFNEKARLWVKGRREQLTPTLDPYLNWGRERPGDRQAREGALAWFHCASLGEFEQGRPVIETFRKEHPTWKILLTFFSPSGYEVRKDYDGADLVMYLPLDTSRSAKRFISAFQPDVAVFVKYEFWYRYIDRLHREDIPIYLISGIFRPQQHFFKWYGGWTRKQLGKFTHFFVQDEQSESLLQSAGIREVTVSGDTRFDRVAAIAENAKEFPLVAEFAGNHMVFLAGSTWPADEELILKLMDTLDEDTRFIIAPHEVDPQRIESLVNKVISRQSSVVSPNEDNSKFKIQNSKLVVLFSQLTLEAAPAARILIVDGIGYLSSLYQYATLAYIGGGFGVGIHNILEGATFGKPVIFGTNYKKFREAVELTEKGGAFPVKDEQELSDICSKLLNDDLAYADASGKCLDYIDKNRGATEVILEGIGKRINAR